MHIEIVDEKLHVLHIAKNFTVQISDEGGFWGVKTRKFSTPNRISVAAFSKKTRPTRADATFEALRQISDWLYPELVQREDGSQSPAREYNGWPNFQTWCVYTWISKDAVLDRSVRNLCSEDIQSNTHSLEAWFVERMLDFVEDQPGVWTDLLTHIIQSEVDWRRIASHYMQSNS